MSTYSVDDYDDASIGDLEEENDALRQENARLQAAMDARGGAPASEPSPLEQVTLAAFAAAESPEQVMEALRARDEALRPVVTTEDADAAQREYHAALVALDPNDPDAFGHSQELHRQYLARIGEAV